MTEEPLSAAALALIAERIAPGATVLRTWPLRGGISATMTGMELGLPRGETRCVTVRQPGRWAVESYPHAAEREFRVLQIVREAGVAAPEPLLADESGTLLPGPFLVVEYLDGEVVHSPADVADFARQIAAALARIHRIDGRLPGLAGLSSASEWLDAARAEKAVEGDDTLNAREIRTLLREVARPGLPLPHPNPLALLHGDAWPGNIIWRDGRLVGLIDWEEAHAGDPLEDLAIARFDVLSMLGRQGMDALTEAYRRAQPQVDFRDLPYWDLYAALRPVGHIGTWADGWIDLGRTDITEAHLRRAHGEFVQQALAQVRNAQP